MGKLLLGVVGAIVGMMIAPASPMLGAAIGGAIGGFALPKLGSMLSGLFGGHHSTPGNGAGVPEYQDEINIAAPAVYRGQGQSPTR